MTEEIWKKIDGFAGLYEVSNLGRVRSVNRVVNKAGVNKRINGKVLKGYVNNMGYPCVDLYDKGKRSKILVHRAVALAFVPNPDGLEIVNHIDENPRNARAENLEWCSSSYNNTFGKMASLNRNKKHVGQYKEGVLLREFSSQSEAACFIGAKTTSCISKSCRTGNAAYGYEWRFL